MTTNTETTAAVPKDPAVDTVTTSVVRVSRVAPYGGYVAERHELIRGVINVHSPCGCTMHVNSLGEYVVTVCNKRGCGFEWHLAIQALRGLELGNQQ